jgi:hypothetical protein
MLLRDDDDGAVRQQTERVPRLQLQLPAKRQHPYQAT